MKNNSNEMWFVLFNLGMWDCEILDIIYNNINNPISIVFEDKEHIIRGLITYKENNDTFLVRAEMIDNFDRWSNAIFEEKYNWNHFTSDCYNPINFYKELLLTYYYMYKNLE